MKSKIYLLIIFFVSITQAQLPKLSQIAPELNIKNELIRKIYKIAKENLDTQFRLSSDGTVYVSTGDIPAEWLRDSSVQVRPFLLFAKQNPNVAQLVKGVIQRQMRYIVLDSYANAFYEDYRIHERKYELDSLTNPILLTWAYWKVTGDTDFLNNVDVRKGFARALETMLIEQDHPNKSKYTHPYLGKNPVAYTGMIWSGYRPSDDACVYNFLIPAQAMAVQALTGMIEISNTVWYNQELSKKAAKLRSEVYAGIEKYGKYKTKDGKVIYAYEVDGLGNALLVDDANLPSLMSLPYYGFLEKNDPIYLETRARNLTSANPYYYSGSVVSGIGSPHTPKNMVWPLSLITQAITSPNKEDLTTAFTNLFNSYDGGKSLHESVDVNNRNRFTRADFGWPNAMYVEMALNFWNQMPEIPKVPSPKRK